MIKFPETAEAEWRRVAYEAGAPDRTRRRIEEGVAIENAIARLRIQHEAKKLFQQELEAEGTPPLSMGTLADYLANPEAAPKDAIQGVVRSKGLFTILGPSGAGKTTVAMQILYCLLSGKDFLGQKAKRMKGTAGIISYDMDASMMYDIAAGFPKLNPATLSVVNAHARGNPLAVDEQRKAIANAWKKVGVRVVMIDSFSASFFGSDQNDAAATMAHYRDMKKFALTEVGADILLLVVHSTTTKPGAARGSSVHQDEADTMMSVVKNAKANNARQITMEKYRAPRGFSGMPTLLITAPDQKTGMVRPDILGMNMLGMQISPSIVGTAAFPPLPEQEEKPDIERGREEEE